MRKIDELKGPSCLMSAEHDEPIFVLRANDEVAPSVVRLWALAYQEQKSLGGARSMTERELSKYREALQLANSMESWKESRP